MKTTFLLSAGVLALGGLGGYAVWRGDAPDPDAPDPAAAAAVETDTLWTLNLDGASPRAGAYWGPRATGSAVAGWSPIFRDSLEREFGPALYHTRAIVLVTEEGTSPEVVITVGLGWEADKGIASTGTYTLALGEGEIAFDAMKVGMAGEGPSHNSFQSGDGSCTPDYCYPPPSSFTVTRFDREWIEGSISGRFWTQARTGGVEDVLVNIGFKARRCIVNTMRWQPGGRTRFCVPIPE